MSGVQLHFEPEPREPGAPFADWPKNEHGIKVVATDGRVLAVEGWYDSIADWSAEVELTDEQRAALHEATAPC